MREREREVRSKIKLSIIAFQFPLSDKFKYQCIVFVHIY